MDDRCRRSAAVPTCLPKRATEGTLGGRLLASVAAALAFVILVEMTLATPPQANEFMQIAAVAREG